MIWQKVIASLFTICLTFTTAYGQIGGLRAFSFMETPNHARLAGMGTVNVSSNAGDVNMVWQNPALLNSDMAGQISFSVNPYFADIYNSQITYAEDFEKVGIFSLGISYFHYGQFEGFDNTGGTTENFNASDYAIQVSHSREDGVFKYGASLKFVANQISGFNQSALLADLGGAFVHPEEELSLGLVIKNLGFFTSKYAAEERNLPFDVQLGGTYKPEFMPFRFSLTLNRLYQYDLSYFDESLLSDDDNVVFTDVNNNSPSTFDKIFQHVTIGTEIILGKNVNLRAGYNHLIRQSLRAEQVGGAGGFTFGVYFQTKKFNMAYSSAIYQAGGFAHFITLGSNLKEFVKKKS
ncbi:type IX secretion system protein PorQ [Marivirga salinae]|uniref:Type IX secretion system protein PorQ n=1 Tax=Marivirga salinarum TaxID=3059078 RepID=A0AA49GCX1_9BACT|nr:type IX secretion system protein PorQ [Marivirga sp. BDSF4-3]WKK73791.2 type IX secretion system protein PorQ [Marivirga sp. BDSF4-3]